MTTSENELEHLLEGARLRVARLMDEARFLEDQLSITNPLPVQRTAVRRDRQMDALRNSTITGSTPMSFLDILEDDGVPSNRHTRRNIPARSPQRKSLSPSRMSQKYPRVSSLESWNPNYNSISSPTSGSSSTFRNEEIKFEKPSSRRIQKESQIHVIEEHFGGGSSRLSTPLFGNASNISALPTTSSSAASSSSTFSPPNSRRCRTTPQPQQFPVDFRGLFPSSPSTTSRASHSVTSNDNLLPTPLSISGKENLLNYQPSSQVSIEDADQIISDFLNPPGHNEGTNTLSRRRSPQLQHTREYLPMHTPATTRSARRSQPPQTRHHTTLSPTPTSTTFTRRTSTPTSSRHTGPGRQPPPTATSATAHGVPMPGATATLLHRLRLSSVDMQHESAAAAGAHAAPPQRRVDSPDESDGEEATLDSERWYARVFGGAPRFARVELDLESLDEETPVQRLLRRYNEGVPGVDGDLLRRFVEHSVQEEGEREGYRVPGEMSAEMRRYRLREHGMRGVGMSVSEADSDESLSQILARLNDASEILSGLGIGDDLVDTSDEEYLTESERAASLAMLESLIALGAAANMPVTPVGATDDEVNAIPVRILGGLVKNSACTAVTSEGTGGSEVVGDTQCCPICLVDFGMGDTVLEFPGCEHCYHRACLVEWLKVSRKCPTCRRELV